MKILHINSYYGAGLFYRNLYDEQVKSSLDIDVYVPVPKSFDSGERDFGKCTKVRRVFKPADRAFFHIKQRKIIDDIRKTYNIGDFQLLHAHSLFTNGYTAMKLSLEYRVPYCVAVRDTDLNVFFKRMIHLRKTGIRILENASRIIFLSPAYRDEVLATMITNQLRDEIRAKSVVIPNGIDKFWFENQGAEKSIDGQKEIKLLQVGEISRRKNQLATVKALRILNKRESGLKYTLTVIGKIKNQGIYRRLTRNSHFNYIEPKSKEELIHLYRDHDIFVMPSIHETFGLVYAEAMSQGLPVIYTRGQGFDGQFEDGEVGYAVQYNDTGEIIERIQRILGKYERISGNCIMNSGKFEWDVIAQKYHEIYESIGD